jgi:hypothetical protein
MANKSDSNATKVANSIRRIASELFGWATAWSPHSKYAYKDMPLFIAFIAIIFSLTVLTGIFYSLFTWSMN